jgi:hypothetical protein
MTARVQWDTDRATARAAAFLWTLALLLLLIPPRANAQKPDGLQQVLPKAHAFVEQFIEQFAYLRCHEDIVQEKLNKDRVQYKQETAFDSLIMVRFEDGQIRVAEQRLVENQPKRPEPRPLLQTSGFSALAMIFHPYYESSFRFTRLADDKLEGKSLARIHFEHIPGTPSPALYETGLADKPLELTGWAWIDPATGAIYRIETEIGSTLADMGMKTLRAELFYGPVSLIEESHPLWLPVSATIDLETPHQHWRNIHHFSDYRQYRVDVKIEPISKKP